MVLQPRSAFLVVDVQQDFCKGGTLAVREGDLVVPVINRTVEIFRDQGGATVYASRDWHPSDTRHFEPQGGAWPPHCVAGTGGARFHRDLRLPSDSVLITKGDAPDADGYSAFEGHTPQGRSLEDDLRARGLRHLYVAGLATDYCVKQSVLDACRLGFTVTVLVDAVRAVEATPGDAERALEAMRTAGAALGHSSGLL